MNIKEGAKSLYIGENENSPEAYITFKLNKDGNYIIRHTVVNEALRGNGIAKKLVDAMIDKALAENVKIIPICSYVVDYFEKYPEKNEIAIILERFKNKK